MSYGRPTERSLFISAVIKIDGNLRSSSLLWTPWSTALVRCSFIWDFVLINKRCLLLVMGSGWGKKKTHTWGKRVLFCCRGQILLRTIPAIENCRENDSCCICAASLSVFLNCFFGIRVAWSATHTRTLSME